MFLQKGSKYVEKVPNSKDWSARGAQLQSVTEFRKYFFPVVPLWFFSPHKKTSLGVDKRMKMPFLAIVDSDDKVCFTPSAYFLGLSGRWPLDERTRLCAVQPAHPHGSKLSSKDRQIAFAKVDKNFIRLIQKLAHHIQYIHVILSN